MFVGEQPGDKEDLEGRPFVGPAGRLFDEALREAGIDRSITYVTNSVKHFKFEARGKRRIHKRPDASEIGACKPWLEGEIAAVQPEMVVCLGAVAAQALLGSSFRVTKQRGEFVEGLLGQGTAFGPRRPVITATVHPSSILRAPDEETKAKERAAFVADLTAVAARLNGVREKG